MSKRVWVIEEEPDSTDPVKLGGAPLPVISWPVQPAAPRVVSPSGPPKLAPARQESFAFPVLDPIGAAAPDAGPERRPDAPSAGDASPDELAACAPASATPAPPAGAPPSAPSHAGAPPAARPLAASPAPPSHADVPPAPPVPSLEPAVASPAPVAVPPALSAARRDPARRKTIHLRSQPRIHPLVEAVLAYLTGPFAVLVTGEGRRSGLWVAIGVSSGLAWLALPSGWERLLFRLDHPAFAVVGWFLLTGCAAIGGFAAWSWGVSRALLQLDPIAQLLPSRLRGPLAAGGAGLLVPGAGLLFSGRRRAAAAALWLPAPIAYALLVSWNEGWIWSWNFAAPEDRLPLGLLEWLLIGVFSLAAGGALGWIGQALEGARCARVGSRSSSPLRGRLAALAFAPALAAAAFAAPAGPAAIAAILDARAVRLEESGYRILPLQLARAALRLDPSRPGYALHAEQLHLALGQTARAAAVRARLDARMAPYVDALRREREPARAASAP